MKPHPLSEILPPLEGAELDALVADIREHGLIQPLVMYQGKILDGRNRWRACERLGVKPKTVDYRGDDPLGYVLSLNLARRHLTPTQRAVVAENIVTFTHGGARSKGSQDPLVPEVSRERAAKIMDTSPGTMKRVRKVLDRGTPALKAAMKDAKIDARTAVKLIDAPEKVQNAAADGGKEVAKEIVKRLEGKAEKEEPPIRTFGLPIPPAIAAKLAKEIGLIEKLSGLLSEMKRTYSELEAFRGVENFGKGKHASSSFRTAMNELNQLRTTKPASVCPYCKMVPEIIKTCAACRGAGYVDELGMKNVHPIFLRDGDDAVVTHNGKETPLSRFSTDDF